MFTHELTGSYPDVIDGDVIMAVSVCLRLQDHLEDIAAQEGEPPPPASTLVPCTFPNLRLLSVGGPEVDPERADVFAVHVVVELQTSGPVRGGNDLVGHKAGPPPFSGVHVQVVPWCGARSHRVVIGE